MKLVTLTATLVLFGTSYALAGPGSGESKEPADRPQVAPPRCSTMQNAQAFGV